MNVVASLILGLVTGAVTAGRASPLVQLVVGTGFCGALSTYSTFSYETLRLLQGDARFAAVTNVVASIVAGLGADFLGLAVSQAIW